MKKLSVCIRKVWIEGATRIKPCHSRDLSRKSASHLRFNYNENLKNTRKFLCVTELIAEVFQLS